MKKALVSATLLLTAAGSWAFYSKPAAAPEYMELSVRAEGSGQPILVLISPTGAVTQQPLKSKEKGAYRYQAQVLVKLNELRSQGWSVVQMQQTETSTPDLQHPLLAPDIVRTGIYLLERR